MSNEELLSCPTTLQAILSQADYSATYRDNRMGKKAKGKSSLKQIKTINKSH